NAQGQRTGFTPVQNATATVDANGIARVTPNPGFTGVINLLVGVRDQTDRSGANNINDPANFDTQAITLTVVNGQPVNLPPIAINGTTTVTTSGPVQVQLNADSGNVQSRQGLTFSIVTPPKNGTISNFDIHRGTLTYTPNPGTTLGTDSFTFAVTDV